MTLPRSDSRSNLALLPTDADPLSSPRVRALAMEIAYRLRPVCGHMPEGELIKLVTRLALAQQGGTHPGSSPST